MAINTRIPDRLSVPVSTPDADEANLVAQKQRTESKAEKQKVSEQSTEATGRRQAASSKQATDAVVQTGAIDKSSALVQALAAMQVTESTSLSDVDVHAALAQFQQLMPLLGRPGGGALATDFAPRVDDVVLDHWPRGLDLASPLVAPQAHSEPTTQQPLRIPTTGPWAKYAKLVEAFWKHDPSALVLQKTPVATPETLAKLAPHIEAVRQMMRSSYAPAMKAARQATAASDVPELPSSTVRELEEAMQLQTAQGVANAVTQAASNPAALAQLKEALAGSTSATPQAIQLAQAVHQHFSPFDDMDVEALVWIVMMEAAKTQEDLVRDELADMQKLNLQKQAQREKQDLLREGSARTDTQMRQEFHMLQAKGDVGPTITFEDYQSFREVAWGDGQLSDDGHFVGPKPTLPPLPNPLPEWLKTGKIKTSDPSGVPSGNNFGLDAATYKALKDLYDLSPEPRTYDFAGFLTAKVKLNPVTGDGKEGIKQIIANLKLAQGALKDPALRDLVSVPDRDQSLIVPQSVLQDAALRLIMLKNLEANGFAVDPTEMTKATDDYNGILPQLKDSQKTAFAAWLRDDMPAALTAYGGLDTLLKKEHDRASADEEDDDNVGYEGNVVISFNDGGQASIAQDAFDDDGSHHYGYSHVIDSQQSDLDNTMSTPVIDVLSSGMKGQSLDFGKVQALQYLLGHPKLDGFSAPTPYDWGPFDALSKSAGAQIQKQIDGYSGVLDLAQNPDGSFYGTVPPGSTDQYATLITDGTIKQGISPDEARKKEAERKAAEEAHAKALSGDGVMVLNHAGTSSELAAAVEEAKGKLDTMGDMSQIEMMRMQQMLDQRSKMLEMLSNIMKKMEQLSDSIIANTK